jgi:hypothetical protein
MSGDPASSDDKELLGQIDELKARMDRLMKGGTSTSNSALLTDEVKSQAAEPADASPPPLDSSSERTRVRDLLRPDDDEAIEAYPASKGVIPFPETPQSAAEPAEHAPVHSAEPEPSPDLPVDPETAPPIAINVGDDTNEPRSPVESFDQLGDAIQQELARDASVPPLEGRKGPGLASRFGPAEESKSVDTPDTAETQVEDPEIVEESVDAVKDEPTVRLKNLEPKQATRPNVGLVAAIWVGTAIASGAIATLHFTGVI